MLVLILLVLVVSALWGYWAIGARRLDHMTASLPGRPTLPIFGNGLLFLGNHIKLLQSFQDFVDLAFKHKDVAKFWLGPRLYIAIANPEDSQVIQDTHLEKDGVYRFLKPWLGQGLFIAPLEIWKSHRKLLLPLFHNKFIQEYTGVFNEQSCILVDRLTEKDGKSEFDVMNYITACTLDIFFETAMGERMDVQHSPDTPYLKARSNVIEIISMRLFKVWLQPDILFNLTTYAKQQKHDINLTHKFTNDVVKKRRQLFEEIKSQEHKTGNLRLADKHAIILNGALAGTYSNKENAVIDLLLRKESKLSNDQLREDIDSLTIAGNDTTALVICYTLVLLGVNQDEQERAYQEQLDIFGRSKRHVTKEDLNKMHHLERVLKESMRLYTVVPIIARSVDKDTYLPHCGVTIPAGTGAVVASFAIHRNKKVWGADADDFRPDRFLPEQSQNRHPAAFQPFSYGARNCIGRHFGMLVMKCILSHILRSYKIKATEVGPLKMEMLLFPINGHKISIVSRK